MNIDQIIETPLFHSDWMTVVLLISGFLIWMVWRNAGGFLEQKSYEVMHGHSRKSLFASNTASEFRMGMVLSTVHVLVVALFIHQLMIYFDLQAGLNVYLMICGLVLLYHTLKVLFVRYLNYLLFSQTNYAEWFKSYQVFNMVLGLLLLPVVVAVTYTWQWVELAMNTGIFLVAIYLITLLVRTINIFFSNLSSFIYVFLYFCVLEILPIMLAVKTVLNSG